MNGILFHTEIFMADNGIPHLIGAYLTAEGSICLRDLGPML
jgi:hypothetical protein